MRTISEPPKAPPPVLPNDDQVITQGQPTVLGDFKVTSVAAPGHTPVYNATPRHGVAGAMIGDRFYAVSGDVQSSGSYSRCDRLRVEPVAQRTLRKLNRSSSSCRLRTSPNRFS